MIVLDWLKQYWFIFTALLTLGIAWGTLNNKVDTLERTNTNILEKEQKIEQIAQSHARLDERTTLMLQEQKQIRDLLNEILQGINKK